MRLDAMIVVEMQNDLAHPRLVSERGLSGALARALDERGVIPRLAALLERCRAAEVPVIYANKERHPSLPPPDHTPIQRRAAAAHILAAGSDGAAVLDEIAPREGDVVLVRYTGIDPSADDGLWSLLGTLRASTIGVAGISTTLAVEGLVRAAANNGFHVVVVEDCCASVPQDWHEFSARNVLPLLAELAPADSL